MESLPLPSHIHYELLLQLLERQSLFAAGQKPAIQDQVQQLIITLRKAMAQQKRLEEACDRHHVAIDYRWSLNSQAEPANHDCVSGKPSVESWMSAQSE